MKTPINISFPLEGKWKAITSPANHIPSHYTHNFGMTYAFDFAKFEDDMISKMKRLFGFDIQKTEAWEEDIFSSLSGKIVFIHNEEDRLSLNLSKDFLSGMKALFFGKNVRTTKLFLEIIGL